MGNHIFPVILPGGIDRSFNKPVVDRIKVRVYVEFVTSNMIGVILYVVLNRLDDLRSSRVVSVYVLGIAGVGAARDEHDVILGS